MKAHRLFPIAALSLWASLAYVAGCKYDVTAPLWDQPYTTPPIPQITSVDPAAEALPGISNIAIHGHNLMVRAADSSVSIATRVLFGSVEVEVASMDTNVLVVRRPNLVSDTAVIHILPHNAGGSASFGPYKIDKVIDNYGGFLQNLQLGAIAVDNTENLYVIESGTRAVHVASSLTGNTLLGSAMSLTPFCARIAPDGNLYVLENNRSIERVTLPAGTVARWTQLPAGKVVKAGDFGSSGSLYAGGLRTGLCIIPPNPPTSLPAAQMKVANIYATDEILAVRVFNGSVYVASRTAGSADPARIWKHPIVADSVGAQSLVLDLGTTPYAFDLVTDIAFTSNGLMFIATASASDPLLSFDPATSVIDNFYKGIVPPYCVGLAKSGASHYLYLITGNTAASQPWTVYRVDVGSAGGM